ncbi:hypothetical protein [Caldimonas brevitalea]|uniref:Uncharacterized protein n=1 Tax=Caldimonas brevitalea TaxID=413882 RepID=A0A0G3BIV1_9BURK|nr:hypothetical protein [Caldimonas brevitalea]AKJ27281.1 hypothetical protein AAW51_0590 [Caldimonas brevitalea]
MHSPNSELRSGVDAFEVRGDVSIEDACRTSLRLVRMTVAHLEMLAFDGDLDELHRDVVEGIVCLARLACGTMAVAQAGLCEGD